MTQSIRFATALVVSLALLTWGASVVVHRTTSDWLIVNPYDLDEASAALRAALTMSLEEQRDRMRAMRALVAEFNVYRWAGRMIVDAARLRSRDRLTGRLTDHLITAPAAADL